MAATMRDTPWMTERDRACVLTLLLRAAGDGCRGALEVLEWGSGGSTIWFPAQLQALKISHRWLTVEHDAAFYAQYCESFLPTVEGCVVPVSLPLTASKAVKAKKAALFQPYIDMVLTRRFDVVIVDGRMRRRCLEAARRVHDGLVILHDARRSWYQCALGSYYGQRVGDALWIGSRHRAVFEGFRP